MSKKQDKAFAEKRTNMIKKKVQSKVIRKNIALLLILCCMSGCGKNSQPVEDEMLTEPEYETRSVIQENETVQVYDGWARMDSMFEGVEYVYYPYVENKIKGVSYVEDSYNENYNQIEVFRSINCPVGCKGVKHKAESCISEYNSQPELEGAFTEEIQNNPLKVIKEGEELLGIGDKSFVNGTLDRTIADKHEILRQDVQAVSFAIYEDFYDTIPELTVKLYGIPTALWEEELGNTMEFSSNQYQDFTNQYYGTGENQYQDNNLDAFDLLAEKTIEKTGVYYVDYNDLHEKGDYIQVLIVLNFDKEMPYTYRMYGVGKYDISDKEAYEEWKNKNIDLFIQ